MFWRCNGKRGGVLNKQKLLLSALVPVVTHFNQTTMERFFVFFFKEKAVLLQEQGGVQTDGLALALFCKVEAKR